MPTNKQNSPIGSTKTTNHKTKKQANKTNKTKKNEETSTRSTISGTANASVATSVSASSNLSNKNHQTNEASTNDDSTAGSTNSDYKLLLKPEFAAMTKITENLFLTGVSGISKGNFHKNHIDFVINITNEAPLLEDVDTIRIPLEDDVHADIQPYLDLAADRINEAIVKHNAHVLVHCVAGVSRSATIVIAYLMKFKRMSLKDAFKFCYRLRPVIRPNNGFMVQLINYEHKLFQKHSVQMVVADVDGTMIHVPDFFIHEAPKLVILEVLRIREQQKATATNDTKS